MADGQTGIQQLAGKGGRRGLLAAAAALAGAGIAKLMAPRPTSAAHFGSDEAFIHVGAVNTTSSTTRIAAPLPTSTVLSVANAEFGSNALEIGDGIQGFTDRDANAAGVRGTGTASGVTHGVLGQILNSTSISASGVRGIAFFGASNGVWGSNASATDTAAGVFGTATASSGATVGVWGRSSSSASGSMGVFGEASGGVGVFGRSQSFIGAYGRSFNGIGVTGESDANTGVYGVSQGRAGVRGRGGQFGVLAETTTGNGVALRAPVSTGVGAFGSVDGAGSGVYGEAATTGNGVLGVSNQGSGVIGRGGQYGVLAETLGGSSVALRARTGAGIGAYCSSTDQNGAGVYGENTSGGGIGVRAFSQGVALYAQGGSRAAVFVGDVEIRGNLIRSGGTGGVDSAVRDGGGVRADDEARVVSDGRGRLVNGRGTVTLPPSFQARADTSEYDVTVSPYGDSRGLFIASRTPVGFEVREQQGGTATLEFGYRVSARAKAAAPGRGTDLGPGGAGARPADGPPVVAPDIAPAWRGDAVQAPAAIPSEWRDVPPPPELPRETPEKEAR